MLLAEAREVIRRCRILAECSEESGFTTRTFLSPPMHAVHAQVTGWMQSAGMTVTIDAAGNIRGTYPSTTAGAPRLFIGSHLDSVPRAGAFDGVLGVIAAIALVETLAGTRRPHGIEVIGFSDEEGVRFGAPFIGSRAFAGTLDDDLLARTDAGGLRVTDAIRAFGLDPSALAGAIAPADSLGYLELHIEQGPVLEQLDRPLAIVETIAGQSRLDIAFTGAANHAGTTPMAHRRDAIAAAAEWIAAVERVAQATPGLVATVGRIDAQPGATNVIAGLCTASLDVRHADDRVRADAVAHLMAMAETIAARRLGTAAATSRLEQPAVPMDGALTARLERACIACGCQAHRMMSGAGHDAMIVAGRMPAAMLFLRTPGGLSHHPDECVREEDLAVALAAGRAFLLDES